MGLPDFKDYKSFLFKLCQRSGSIVKSYFDQDIGIEYKQDNSPVTIADKKTEEFLRESLRKEFPDHGIIGEEFGEENTDSEFCWVLDPIDGTKSFISGVPLFGTLIALTHNKKPVLGVFYQPISEHFLIGDNQRTFLGDMKITSNNKTRLGEARLLTTDILDIQKHQDMASFWELAQKVKFLRTWGDCYGYYLLVCSKAEIMLDPILSVWDSMALIPILRGANLRVSGWKGEDPETSDSLIAANHGLHPEIMELLKVTQKTASMNS